MTANWNLEEKMPDLESILESIESLTYELRNCVRGCHTRCTTYKELGEYIQELGEKLAEEGGFVSEVEEDPEEE